MKNNHIIMLFIDGFGIGKANIEENPLSADYMPYLNNCLGRPPTTLEVFENEKLIYIPTDANLGLKGIPQSATGQTTLFTGCNASKILGYHLPAYPNKPLIKLINQYSIFKQLVSLGYIPTSANAYSQEYFKLVEKGKLKHSATTLSVLAAQNENPQKSNLAFRMEKEMKNDLAVYMDITNKLLIEEYGYNLEYREPQKAGEILAHLAKKHHFVLFEYFLTDVYAHKQDKAKIINCLKDIDGLLKGILENLEDNILLITSDHGNIEDLTTHSHTRNPIPTIIFTKSNKIKRLWRKRIHTLEDITPTIIYQFSQ